MRRRDFIKTTTALLATASLSGASAFGAAVDAGEAGTDVETRSRKVGAATGRVTGGMSETRKALPTPHDLFHQPFSRRRFDLAHDRVLEVRLYEERPPGIRNPDVVEAHEVRAQDRLRGLGIADGEAKVVHALGADIEAAEPVQP